MSPTIHVKQLKELDMRNVTKANKYNTTTWSFVDLKLWKRFNFYTLVY